MTILILTKKFFNCYQLPLIALKIDGNPWQSIAVIKKKHTKFLSIKLISDNSRSIYSSLPGETHFFHCFSCSESDKKCQDGSKSETE